MTNHNKFGFFIAPAHDIAERTQQSIDNDNADQEDTEYLPYPDDNFEEIVDDRFQRNDKFTIEHIYRRTGQAFVPNVPVDVKSIVAEFSNDCSAALIDPHLTQDENNEYPFFPKRNHQEGLVNDSNIEEYSNILVDYLNKVLKHPKFRAHPAMREFFEVSCLSFIHGLSVSRKEGHLLKQSDDHCSDRHTLFSSFFCDSCECHHGLKWFVIKDSYIVNIRPDTHEVRFPMLVDRGFQVLTGIDDTGSDDGIKVSNLQQTFVGRCPTARDRDKWIENLSNLTEQAKDFVSATGCRFNSYVPIRENQLAYWFINGKSYMQAVAKALLTAKEEVFITDWWLSPEVMLIRPTDDETFRLDNILGRIADAGVRVYVMIYKEIPYTVSLNSLYTEKKLLSKSTKGFIKVIRHPDLNIKDRVILWSHHEKMVIIDQKIAFVGGIDLCYGRWDDEYMRLVDLGDENDTTLKSSSEIAAENVASGNIETVEAAQITTTQMAEEAGEIPIKSSKFLRSAFAPLNEINEEVVLPDSTDENEETFDIKSTVKDYHLSQNNDDADNNEILEEQQSLTPSTLEIDRKNRYFIGKDYSNAYKKDVTNLEDYSTDYIDRKSIPRMPWHDEAMVVFGQTARDTARHFIQRWNIHKHQKYPENDFYPFLLPKSYDDTEDLTVENWQDFLESEPFRVNAQCVRSVGPWSAKTKSMELSIQNAYIQMIDAAKHFIYIENQFFITIAQDEVVRNKLSEVLFQRIKRAYKNDEKFRVYILLPLLPGFDNMKAVQAVLYFIMRSIIKGDNSLFKRLEKAGITPSDYISCFGMRNHDILMGRLVTEIIYVHSKLMIIDDHMAICGSANINDRSLVGNRDSEFCIVIDDVDEEDSQFNGQPVRVGKFCSSWRKKIFEMLLGIQFENPNNIDVTDPVSDEFYCYFQNVAKQNTLIYEEVFATMPTDHARTFAQVTAYNDMAKLKDTDPIEAQEKLKGIQGFVVEYPLYFLDEENYLPDWTSREGKNTVITGNGKRPVPETVGTSLSQLNFDYGSYSPTFEKKLIEENRQDGYWIEPFQVDNQSPIGLVAYGLASGDIHLYQNLSTTKEPGQTTLIQKLNGPVAMDQADITGNGINDIIICYQYGNTMLDTDPEGGKIVWLENPGQNIVNNLWEMHYVGKSTAMHRLKVGHFTQTKRWEIIGLPIVSKPYDLLSAVPVLLFRQPDNVLNATEWPFEIINENFFHLIHDAKRLNDGQLDNLLIASSEGINRLYFSKNLKQWMIEKIGEGEQEQKQQTTYYGSGGIDVGRVGNDPLAYMAAIEPFHGNVIAIYIKNTNNVLTQFQWKRYVLDIYGYPNENGEGTAHHIVCADFDNDGDDEFLVALRGPSPNQGVYFYKSIDLSRGLFNKWKVSGDSAARIAVADYDNDKLLDFATISYNVPGYYRSENPSINVFYNRFTQNKPQAEKEMQVMKQNNDLLFKVPRPNEASQYQELPFITIDGIRLSLAIVPPHSSRQVDNNTYIKVLSGIIIWTDSSNQSYEPANYSRTIFCEPRTVAPLKIHSDNRRIRTESEGALLIIFKTRNDTNPIHQVGDMKNMIIENSLPEYCPEETRQLDFEFIRYDQYDSRAQFKNLEFYTLKGFGINFADNNEHLCYMQLWAAGQGVNAGVHNHAKDRFCEIHISIINGSEEGGIHYLRSSEENYDPLTTPDSAFEKLPMPPFYEQGPLWDIDAQNKPVLRNDGTVVYPWHKWQSGINRLFNQSFDVWLVVAFKSELSTLPASNESNETFVPNVLNMFLTLLFVYIHY
ncbi:unnamed protein product [Rotaria sp. Silwood1]|nr:unnamed protein product [Rotaria sp. Silwood1]